MKTCNVHGKKRIGLLVSVVTFCLFMIMTAFPVYADPPSGDDSGDVETVGDIYDVSTALTAYVNNVVGANGNDKHNNQRVENPGSVGNAGAYVGYGDEKQKFVSFITSNTTVGTSTSTYDAWEDIIDSTDSDKNAAYAYVRLGKTLSDAGLDETISADTNFDFPRIIMGGISLLVFSAGEIVPFAFNIALGILKALNVFALFGTVGNVVTNTWQDAFPDAPDVLSPLRGLFGGLYSDMLSPIVYTEKYPEGRPGVTLLMIALLIALLVVNIFLLRKSAGHQMITFLKRVVFMLAGLPLCGLLYTSCLNHLYDITREGTASAKLVAASFVDFEEWANSGLNMTGLTIESSPKGTDGAINKGGAASEETLQQLRNTSLKINAKGKGFNHPFVGWAASGFGNSSHDVISGDLWDTSGNIVHQSTATDSSAVASIYNMLVRYIKADTYTSSAWASNLKQTVFKDVNIGSADPEATDTKKSVRAMFEATDEVGDWMRRETQDNERIWDGTQGTDMEWTSESFNIFRNGDMKLDGVTGEADQPMKWTGRLSDLSMYNYLATRFDESSIITYSNATSVSEHVKQAHTSVTAIGSGVLGFVLLLNMWVCIGITALIGVYFAISTTLKNLKTSFQLIASVPMAMMGAVKSIAQVIIYTVMLMVQVVLGAVMYTFLAEFLVVFATVIENIVSSGNVDGPQTVSILLASIGFDTNMIADSEVTVTCMIVAELIALLIVGYAIWHYRRVCVRAYDCALYRAMKWVTVEECRDVFESVWKQKKVVRPETGYVPSGAMGVLALLCSDLERERGCMTHA